MPKENGKSKLGIYKFPLNTEDGKRITCDSPRLLAEWISIGKKNDADSAGYRGEKFNIA